MPFASKGNGTIPSDTFDAASRLASLTHDPTDTGFDATFGFAYNPASQMISCSRNEVANSGYVAPPIGIGIIGLGAVPDQAHEMGEAEQAEDGRQSGMGGAALDQSLRLSALQRQRRATAQHAGARVLGRGCAIGLRRCDASRLVHGAIDLRVLNGSDLRMDANDSEAETNAACVVVSRADNHSVISATTDLLVVVYINNNNYISAPGLKFNSGEAKVKF